MARTSKAKTEQTESSQAQTPVVSTPPVQSTEPKAKAPRTKKSVASETATPAPQVQTPVVSAPVVTAPVVSDEQPETTEVSELSVQSGEFLSRLSDQTEIEIHYRGRVFFWEYLDYYQSGGVINLRLKLLTVKKNEEELSLHDVSLPIKLLDVSEPYVIKEDGWDLIWFSFDGGHMVFYFKKPEGVL